MLSKVRSVFTLVVCFLCFSSELRGQDPHFSQYFSNPIFSNPAFAGSTLDSRFSLTYRNQWPNIPGAFSTVFAGYDRHFDVVSGGVGLAVFSDRQGNGAYVNTSAALMYSYRLQVANGFYIKAGAQASFVNRYIDWQNLVFADQIDPLLGIIPGVTTQEKIPPSPVSKRYSDFAVGLLGYSETFYAGVSVAHLSRPDEGYVDLKRLPIKIAAQVGGVIYFSSAYGTRRNEKMSSLSPNLIYTRQGEVDMLNYGSYVNVYPMIFGLFLRQSFTNVDALIGLVGVKVNNMRFGYSYDMTLSRLSKGGGAHEISFSLQIPTKEKVVYRRVRPTPCPIF